MTRSRYGRRAFGVGIALTLVFTVAAPTSAALVTSFPLPRTLRNADRIAPGPDGALWFTQEAYQKHTSALGRITTGGAASAVAIPAGSSALALTAGPDLTERCGMPGWVAAAAASVESRLPESTSLRCPASHSRRPGS